MFSVMPVRTPAITESGFVVAGVFTGRVVEGVFNFFAMICMSLKTAVFLRFYHASQNQERVAP